MASPLIEVDSFPIWMRYVYLSAWTALRSSCEVINIYRHVSSGRRSFQAWPASHDRCFSLL